MIDVAIKAWIEPAITKIVRFGFPWIYFLEFAFWLTLVGGFFGVVGFVNAIPASLLGRSLPPSWEAAVKNHGEFIRWYLKDNHPVAFSLTVLVFLASVVGMVLVHIAEVRIRRTKGGGKSEKIAVIALMATVLLMSYLVMMHLARMYMVPAALDGLSTGTGRGGG